MEIYFSSDLHFYHKNIQKYQPDTRPQDCSIEEMNELIIEAHNKKVSPQDIWWHLGDFSFGTEEQTIAILKRMNGNKNFVRGNHDKIIDRSTEIRKLLGSYRDYSTTRVGKCNLIMFHFPIESWDRKHHGAIHLHGHMHGGGSHYGIGHINNRMDVGIDNRADLSPWSFDEIQEYLKKHNG